MAPAAKPVTFVAGAATGHAPQPLTLVGPLPTATSSAAGGVKQAAVVAPATVGTDATTVSTQFNALLLALRAAGTIA